MDRDLSARIRIDNWKTASGQPLRVSDLSGKEKVGANPFGSSGSVNIREKKLAVEGLSLIYTFPAHSVTVSGLEGSL
jgi:hypothetical protein